MFVTCTGLWSLLILQIILALPTGAVSEDETATGNLALTILSVSSTTVNVQWNCTQVKEYYITWRVNLMNALEKWERTDMKVLDHCQNTNNIGQNFNMTLTDLEEGMRYKVLIKDSYLYFDTLTSMPSGPPIYLRAHPVNPATMHISWTRPKLLDCNGDILQYIIMVDSDSDEHNYTFNVTSGCVSKACSNKECFYHSFNVPKDELIPHLEYSVRIAAVNINGTGPFSNAITVMSGDDKPGPPENLMVVKSGEEPNEFILQWDMPKNPNGAILRYKIEYGVTNNTPMKGGNTSSTNYTLKLSGNETYTIAVSAENIVGRGNATEISWSLLDDSGDGDNSSNNLEDYKIVIISSCVGAFVLILLACIIVCIRSKYKRSSHSSSRSRKFYPADPSKFTVVNLGYRFTESGTSSLPYDYPYIEANGAQASSATTFQPQTSSRSTNRNSSSTCGYIDIPAQANNNSRPHPVGYAVPNSPSNSSEHSSIVSPSLSNSNSANHSIHASGGQNDTRALLSPPANGAGVNTNANTVGDNGYVTLHN